MSRYKPLDDDAPETGSKMDLEKSRQERHEAVAGSSHSKLQESDLTTSDEKSKVVSNNSSEKTSDLNEDVSSEDKEFYHVSDYPKQKDDAGIESTTRKDTDIKLPKVKNLVARLHSDNPVRSIIINWDKLESIKNFQLKVCLKSGQNNIKELFLDRFKQEACFKGLKSNTCYTAYISVVDSKQESETISSNPVTTAKAYRNEDFDIAKDGKVEITACSAVREKNGLVSLFTWRLPKLGTEEINYDIVEMQATIKADRKSSQLEVEEGNTGAKAVCLEFGTKYEFSVKRVYLDLDKRVKHEAICKHILHTDIDIPLINEVKCHGQEITISWSPARGATKHFLKVDGFSKQFTKQMDVKNLTFTFKVSEPQCYGRKCTLTIEAEGSAHKTSKSLAKQALIGGDKAVTDVVIEKCMECPRRRVLVRWEPPICTPEGYTLQLCEHEDGKSKEAFEEIPLEQIHFSHKFVELKTNTMYFCKVFPRYDGNKEYCSMSNMVKTDERVGCALETEEDFGKPEVLHTSITTESGDHMTEISWKMVNTGENYKVSQYKVVVEVYQKSLLGKIQALINKSVYDKKFSANITKAEIPNLQIGYKYDVRVTSSIIDLDTGNTNLHTKDYYFHTEPSKTEINDYECKDGVITFTWTKVIGAERYCLIMKDELQTKKVANDVFATENKCEVQMTKKLCIGRTCMTKVIAYANEMTSESEWKAHLLGGILVPRNVKARRNSDNPKRSVIVTFDAPKQGTAAQYKIVARPEEGKQKTFFFSTSPSLIEYLRKGIQYKFEVHAEQGNDWSAGSPSNHQKTDGGDENSSAMSFSNIGGPVNNQGSTISGSTRIVNIPQGDSFGKVRDLQLVLVDDKTKEKDKLTLSWKIPTFNNDASDYKVEKYNVEVRKKDSEEKDERSLDFKKGLASYSSGPFELDLGEKYELSVSTTYIDIDKDEEQTSSGVKKTLQTRPRKPHGFKSKIVNDDKALKIEWNAAKGAKQYEVEIYTEESDTKPFVEKNVGTETTWLQTFDDGFGYGTSYHTVITAIGEENRMNSLTTASQTIGGDSSPKKVHATIKHEKVTDPNTQVYLSWESPAKQPESYEISYENAGKTMKESSRNTEYLITGLKAGEYYTFKVVAVHYINLIKTKSGSPVSNKIQTNPTPTQVHGVGTSSLDNPSTSIKIRWNEVDAEKNDELTVYRVTVTALDKGTSREINNVTRQSVCIFGLEPDTEYFTTVAGGNSIGFGKDSRKCKFRTALGMPKGVMLLSNKESPSTSLLLKFSDAEGEPLSHSCSLYRNNQVFRDKIQVDSGYIFNDLEPNTKYYALVHAVFKNERTGKPIKSRVVLTAPSKPLCCIDNSINSSKDFLLKWNSEEGCNEHEVQIKHGDEIDSEQIVKNKSSLRYSCRHEASQYTARMRSKNDLFGPWSNKVVIALAPKAITLLSVELEKETSNFLIRCKKATSGCLSYFCKAFCDGKTEGELLQVQPKETDDVVNFTFEPIQEAANYHFELWAEGNNGLRGQSTYSENMISRPGVAKIEKVERKQENPSMDIIISWQTLDRCDGYEVKIKRSGQQKPESIVRTTDKTTCTYRCQCYGSKYGVRVRGICSLVRGYWSEKNFVELAPAEVQLIEDKEEQEPVETVRVKWKELEPKPTCYHVILYQGDVEVKFVKIVPSEKNEPHPKPIDQPSEEVEPEPKPVELPSEDVEQGPKLDEIPTEEIEPEPKPVELPSEENELEPKLIEFVFKDVVKPGFLYHCIIAAQNHGVSGKPIKSKYYRIKWNNPELLSIRHSENDPSRRAKISWVKPDGVNCFRLEIENNQLGTVIFLQLTKDYYVFESGIPGNSYAVRLYCGCDGHYSPSYVQAKLRMKPDPPINVKAVANSHVNGIIVTFKGSSTILKTTEICAKRLVKEGENEETNIEKTTTERATLKNLVPGGSYEVSVTALCNGARSKTLTLNEYVLTYPSEVENLHSAINNTGEIVYKWNALEIPPDEYIVQWRVNNEPIMEESTEETEFVIRFLKPSHSYNLRVTASNSAGKGKFSKWNTFSTVPSEVENLHSAINDTGEIVYKWDALEIPPDKYIIQWRVNNEPIMEESTEETEFVIRFLKPSHSYCLRVMASNSAGKGKISKWNTFTTVPSEVKNLRSEIIDNREIVYEWDAPEKPPDEYIVQWRVNNEPIIEESTEETEFVIRFLKPSHSYSLRVMASNSAGKGKISKWNTFTTASFLALRKYFASRATH